MSNYPKINSVCMSNGLPGKIIQYDISSNDSILINNSRVSLFTSPTVGCFSLKLAPNKKIYVAHSHDFSSSSGDYIGIIDFPDSLGLGASYTDSALYLNGKYSSWGLNNLMEYGNYCSLSSGLNEKSVKISDLKIYPNPANEQITLEFNNPTKEKLTAILYDPYGRVLRKISNIEADKLIIDTRNLTRGLYFVQLLTDRQIISAGKFILE